MNNIKQLFDSYRHFRIESYKPNIYQVFSPYHYDDGDMYIIFLEQVDEKTLCLRDFGSTYMSMYGLNNIEKYDYAFQKVLRAHGLSEAESGEISIQFDITDFDTKLNDYLMGITKLTSTEYFEKERNTNRFYTQFNDLIADKFQAKFQMEAKYKPLQGEYSECEIPWAITKTEKAPIFIFPVSGRQKLKSSLLTLHDLREEEFFSFNCSVYENVDSLDKQDMKRANRLFEKQINSYEAFIEHGEFELDRMLKFVS